MLSIESSNFLFTISFCFSISDTKLKIFFLEEWFFLQKNIEIEKNSEYLFL